MCSRIYGALISTLATKLLCVENQESLLSDLLETLKKKDARTPRPNRGALNRKSAMESLDAEDQKSLLSDLSESLRKNDDEAPRPAIAEIQEASEMQQASSASQDVTSDSRDRSFLAERWCVVPKEFKVDSVQNPATLILVKQDYHEKAKEKVGFYNGVLSALSGPVRLTSVPSANWCLEFCSPMGTGNSFHPSGFFITSGWGDNPNTSVSDLQVICPGTTRIDNLVLDFASHSQVVNGHSLNAPGSFYVAFDEGDGSKGGLGGCYKQAAVHDEGLTAPEHPDRQITVAPLDADKSGDTSEDVAAAVHRSVCRLGLREDKKASGATWDSAGGGIRDPVDRGLKALGCVCEHGLRCNCACPISRLKHRL
jgi:hypothetical protein